MKTKMTLRQRLRAHFSGKKIFWIEDLQKITFASSIEQCKAKFKGHETYVYPFEGFKNVFWFVLTGNYPADYSPSLPCKWGAVMRRMRQENSQSKLHLRKGQILFNSLFEIDQEVADLVRGSFADPFYDDAKSDACTDFVLRYWIERGVWKV